MPVNLMDLYKDESEDNKDTNSQLEPEVNSAETENEAQTIEESNSAVLESVVEAKEPEVESTVSENVMSEEEKKSDQQPKQTEESTPGFFKRIFTKIDESMKEKADDDCCGGGKCCGIDFGTCGGGICAVLCCGLCGDGEGAYQTVGMNICGGCCHVTCVKCPNALAGYGSPERLVISKEGACDIDKMPGAPTPEAMERGT